MSVTRLLLQCLSFIRLYLAFYKLVLTAHCVANDGVAVADDNDIWHQ
jgi:hypothetical protein